MTKLADELIAACAEGDVEEAARLLEAGANPNESDGGGHTPMSVVLAHFDGVQDAPLLRLLVEHGADVHETEVDHSENALMRAADRGDLELVELLLAKGARHDDEDGDHETAADHAARAGEVAVLERLVALAPQRNDDARLWALALQGAARKGDVPAIEKLLARPALAASRQPLVEAWVAACGKLNPDCAAALAPRVTPALTAEELGRGLVTLVSHALEPHEMTPGYVPERKLAFVRQLLDQGAPVDARDLHGKTSLFYARNAALAALLRERGADPQGGDPTASDRPGGLTFRDKATLAAFVFLLLVIAAGIILLRSL